MCEGYNNKMIIIHIVLALETGIFNKTNRRIGNDTMDTFNIYVVVYTCQSLMGPNCRTWHLLTRAGVKKTCVQLFACHEQLSK